MPKKINFNDGLNYIFKALILTIVAEVFATVIPCVFWNGAISYPLVIGGIVIQIVIELWTLFFVVKGFNLMKKENFEFKYLTVLYILSFVLLAGYYTLQIVEFGSLTYIFLMVLSDAFKVLAFTLMAWSIASSFKGNKNKELSKKGASTSFVFALLYTIANSLEVIIVFYLNDFYALEESAIISSVIFVLILIALIKLAIYVNKANKNA